VRQLLITVNRLLAPPHLQEAFESYIVRALIEEIDRIEDYYAERAGGFWVRPLSAGLSACSALSGSAATKWS
jgi:hypothetical protein